MEANAHEIKNIGAKMDYKVHVLVYKADNLNEEREEVARLDLPRYRGRGKPPKYRIHRMVPPKGLTPMVTTQKPFTCPKNSLVGVRPSQSKPRKD